MRVESVRCSRFACPHTSRAHTLRVLTHFACSHASRAHTLRVLTRFACPHTAQLSGTSPHEASAEVEEALASSRSRMFAKEEDIKQCAAEILRNAPAPILVEAALQRESGSYLTDTGALSVRSGAKTGRSPKDKRVVDEPNSTGNVWWGPVNIKMSHEAFMINRERAIDYINTRERIYVVDGYAGHDPKWRVAVRVICVRAYHALFMKNMLVDLSAAEEAQPFVPGECMRIQICLSEPLTLPWSVPTC